MLAPIVIFAYNRPWHLRHTLQSLQQNELADQSRLFIFIDGPKNDATIEQKNKIEEVRQVAREKKWCMSTEIIESITNKGLATSVTNGVSEIINKYGKIIVLEDDLVSDIYFLRFMNDALDKYENDENVACISGYIYPVKKELPSTFFLKGADCWGWATYKRAWDELEYDGVKLLKELETKNLARDFDFFGTYPYTQMLKDKIERKNNSWAILWYASAYLKNKLTLYPGSSLIQNIGTDGSGTHSSLNENFKVSLRNKKIEVITQEVKEDLSAKNIIAEYFKTISNNPNLYPNKFFNRFKSLFKK